MHNNSIREVVEVNLKVICKCAMTACCLLALTAVAATAQQPAGEGTPSLSAGLDVAYVTRYVWRGLELNPDPVVQPSLTLSHPGGVSFNWWGSVDTTRVFGQRGNFTEIDYTLSYAWSAHGRPMAAGLISYTFPNTDFASTAEAFVSAEFGGPLSPAISINYDFDEADGYYASLSLGHSFAAPWRKEASTSVDVSARLSFASSDYVKFYFPGADGSAFTDLLLTAEMPMPISDRMTITPSIGYSTLLDGDLKDTVTRSGLFYAGVTLSVSF